MICVLCGNAILPDEEVIAFTNGKHAHGICTDEYEEAEAKREEWNQWLSNELFYDEYGDEYFY